MENYDEIVNDIFEQDEKKKRKNLYNIQQYNENEYIGANDFDIGYRTTNKTEDDLIPSKYIEHNEGDLTPEELEYGKDLLGSMDYEADELNVVNKKYFENPLLKMIGRTQHNVLRHENFHKKQHRYKTDSFVNVKPNISINSEIDAFYDIMSMNTNIKNKMYVRAKRITKTFPKNINKQGWLDNQFTKYDNSPEELYADYVAFFPEKILNPKTKMDKKLTRIMFE